MRGDALICLVIEDRGRTGATWTGTTWTGTVLTWRDDGCWWSRPAVC
jgi:hypothetical protein